MLPGLEAATDDTLVIQEFAQQVGFPIMIKAVDGGGGRGIRLVRQQGELAQAAKKAIEESPSHRVIAEKAVVDGFRHVEVQILGDGRGNIRHLWERECSIQRRYQKVIEFAPSSFKSRDTIARVIQDAMKMAQTVCKEKQFISSHANVSLRCVTSLWGHSNFSWIGSLRETTTSWKLIHACKWSIQSPSQYL